MKRYLVAFASALVGLALTAPYAVLRFRDLPPPPPPVAGAPPRQMTAAEMIAVAECCVVFYAITYLAGRSIYAWLASRQELAELQSFSGGHMALLHALAGTFMVASPWLDRPAGNPLTAYITVGVGLAMLSFPLCRIVAWARSKVAPAVQQPQSHRLGDKPHDGD